MSDRPWHPLFSPLDERPPGKAPTKRSAGMIIEEYDEHHEPHWFASLDGTPNPVKGMAVELFTREDAETVADLADALRDALSGLEYVRYRYGALDGVGWDRIDEYRKRWMLGKEAGDGE